MIPFFEVFSRNSRKLKKLLEKEFHHMKTMYERRKRTDYINLKNDLGKFNDKIAKRV